MTCGASLRTNTLLATYAYSQQTPSPSCARTWHLLTSLLVLHQNNRECNSIPFPVFFGQRPSSLTSCEMHKNNGGRQSWPSATIRGYRDIASGVTFSAAAPPASHGFPHPRHRHPGGFFLSSKTTTAYNQTSGDRNISSQQTPRQLPDYTLKGENPATLTTSHHHPTSNKQHHPPPEPPAPAKPLVCWCRPTSNFK